MPPSTALLTLEGEVTLAHVGDLYHQLHHQIQTCTESHITLDAAGIKALDSAGAVLIQTLPRLAERHQKMLAIQNIPPPFQEVLEYFAVEAAAPVPPASPPPFLERLGDGVYRAYQSVVQLLVLIVDILWWSVIGIFNRSGARRGAFMEQCILLGSQAFGIVALILFLIGFVTALQSSAQLRQFGATIYVANLLAIGIARELGPLMTAIIVSGRSGSSIAAEIATMKFTEELDALKTMALNPIRFVVVPKFLAMTLCIPLLTVFANIMGIAGGFLVGITYLDLSAAAFGNQVLEALLLKDVLTGLIKSVSFAWVITIVAVYRGFNFKGGAEGVGIATTSSVVTSIFMIIVVDSFWGILFYFG